jgi:hypothetical protein
MTVQMQMMLYAVDKESRSNRKATTWEDEINYSTLSFVLQNHTTERGSLWISRDALYSLELAR